MADRTWESNCWPDARLARKPRSTRKMQSPRVGRRASEFGLSRPTSQIATEWQYKRHGDRVRVRDGSTRLSFFAVRLLISGKERNEQYRGDTSTLVSGPNHLVDFDQPLFFWVLSASRRFARIHGAKTDIPRERGRWGSWFEVGIVSFEQGVNRDCALSRFFFCWRDSPLLANQSRN